MQLSHEIADLSKLYFTSLVVKKQVSRSQTKRLQRKGGVMERREIELRYNPHIVSDKST